MNIDDFVVSFEYVIFLYVKTNTDTIKMNGMIPDNVIFKLFVIVFILKLRVFMVVDCNEFILFYISRIKFV